VEAEDAVANPTFRVRATTPRWWEEIGRIVAAFVLAALGMADDTDGTRYEVVRRDPDGTETVVSVARSASEAERYIALRTAD
jgi:hypothetical protein